MNLLVSGLYKLYVYLVWLSAYPTGMVLYVLFFICFLILSLFVTCKIRPKSDNYPIILGFSPYKITNRLVILPVFPILFCTRPHVLTASVHKIFQAVLFNFVFMSIANALSLMTENLASMVPFNWGVWGVVYPNVIFYFSHSFFYFDWCSLELSQCKYVTGVPCDIFFQGILSFFGSGKFIAVKKIQ